MQNKNAGIICPINVTNSQSELLNQNIVYNPKHFWYLEMEISGAELFLKQMMY